MHRTGYQSYLENEIRTSDPLKLIGLLYRGVMDTVELARQRLREGDIRGRSQAITKGLAILHELTVSLDHRKAGDLSARLAALYDYIERLLIDANVKQHETPLIEASKLLSELLAAWQACRPVDP